MRVLYLGRYDLARWQKVMDAMKGTPLLIVGEGGDFLERGGIVQLICEGNTIQFQVDLAAARKAGIQMDARLLTLAKRVLNGGEAPGG